MTSTDKTLCAVYGLTSAGALVGTWSHNIAFMRETGGFSALEFIRASNANHAAASISVDLLFFCLAAFVLIVVEARRLRIRHVWVYILLSLTIAVSVMFPLFLIARQRRLADDAGAA
jgi:hypothetical protein